MGIATRIHSGNALERDNTTTFLDFFGAGRLDGEHSYFSLVLTEEDRVALIQLLVNFGPATPNSEAFRYESVNLNEVNNDL